MPVWLSLGWAIIPTSLARSLHGESACVRCDATKGQAAVQPITVRGRIRCVHTPRWAERAHAPGAVCCPACRGAGQSCLPGMRRERDRYGWQRMKQRSAKSMQRGDTSPSSSPYCCCHHSHPGSSLSCTTLVTFAPLSSHPWRVASTTLHSTVHPAP